MNVRLLPLSLLLLWGDATQCAGKTSAPYRFLVLEGGGTKGIANGGNVLALHSAGMLQHFQGFAGSSSGSQAAALLAAGYNGPELLNELMNLEILALLDGTIGRFFSLLGGENNGWALPSPMTDITRFMTKFGMFSGEKIQQMIDELIFRKTGVNHTTFRQLYEKTGKLLRITGTSLTGGTLSWFDKDLTPDMPVALAVRASSTIPGLFQPVEWGDHLYVDGGLLLLLPHLAFKDLEGATLCLRIRPPTPDEKNMTKHNVTNFIEYFSAIVDTVLFGKDSHNTLQGSWINQHNMDVVVTDTSMIPVTDIDLSEDMRVRLVQEGFLAVMSHLTDCGVDVPPPAAAESSPPAAEPPVAAESCDEPTARTEKGKLPELTNWLDKEATWSWVAATARAAVKRPTIDKNADQSTLTGLSSRLSLRAEQILIATQNYQRYQETLKQWSNQLISIHQHIDDCLEKERLKGADGNELRCSIGQLLGGEQQQHQQANIGPHGDEKLAHNEFTTGGAALHHLILVFHYTLKDISLQLVLAVVVAHYLLLLHFAVKGFRKSVTKLDVDASSSSPSSAGKAKKTQ